MNNTPDSPSSNNKLPFIRSDVKEVFTCRICFEDEKNLDTLCQPCRCSGSSQYVHKSCLEKWRARHHSNHEAYKKCMECGYTYQIQEESGCYGCNIYQCILYFSYNRYTSVFLTFWVCIGITFFLEDIQSLHTGFDDLASSLHLPSTTNLSMIPSWIMGTLIFTTQRHLYKKHRQEISEIPIFKGRTNCHYVLFCVSNVLLSAYAIIIYSYYSIKLVMKHFSEVITVNANQTQQVLDYPHDRKLVEITNPEQIV